MRLTAFTVLISALLALCAPAFAVQDTPINVNGVEMVCTGVGSAKDDPRWSAYPVKLVLATAGGAFLANAHIRLLRGSEAIAESDCDAPWILFKLPAGEYTASASLIGGSGKANSVSFATTGTPPQKEVTITFARSASSLPSSTSGPSTTSLGQ